MSFELYYAESSMRTRVHRQYMDPRIRRHAEILVDHSTNIASADDVLICAPSGAKEFVRALYEVISKAGASPGVLMTDSDIQREQLDHASISDLHEPRHVGKIYDESDTIIVVCGDENMAELSDITPEKLMKNEKNLEKINNRLGKTDSCFTLFPMSGNAGKANMYPKDFEDFVWDIINSDWNKQKQFQKQLVKILQSGNELRIVDGHTNLKIDLTGVDVVNEFGQLDMPGGEVFINPDDVNGKITLQKTNLSYGREISDIQMEIRDGTVIKYQSSDNQGLLNEIISADSESNEIGEIGIGMNKDVHSFTYTKLLDKKAKGNFRVTLGKTRSNSKNSIIQFDMISDISEGGSIEVDGKTIQQNGEFSFE